MGLIDDNTAYATEYGKSFPWMALPGIYVLDIDKTKDAYLDRRKKEAVHKSTISDWEIYDVAEIEANRFIVSAVADVWIYPLSKGFPTFYVTRMTKELLNQIQVVCTRQYTIDLLALQEEMWTMHVTTNTIPQYITTLEKARLHAERADMPIPDNYLMMVATKAMLSYERFPRANKDFEDLNKGYKSWANWCKLYTKAGMKETIIIQAGLKEVEQFGGAVLSGAGVGEEPPAGCPTPVTVEYLGGCFDSLAGVAVIGKVVLE